ncbi:MAG: FAD-dependent oxidoreductase [Actinobacteria bacterium]|nr:FAD-dependent oxidoreductase [Actinomycetota bacterium]
MSKSVVIVGASMGGLRAAEALRNNGFAGRITMIGEEAHLPYNRPPLSKEVLAKEVTHEAVAFKLRAQVEDVTWHLGDPATSVDLEKKVVTTASGKSFEYDGLVIASGLRPRVLDLPNGKISGRHTVRTLDDAIGLRAELVPGAAKVVVAGAGFIGCEVAATARGLGCEVTNVAIDPYPMIRPLGEQLAAELQRRHESHGVKFKLNHGISDLTGTEKISGVVLDNGEVIQADVLVEAISSHCNVEWLASTNLDVSNGVLADSALRAVTTDGKSVEGVYVVGDLARFANPLFDNEPRRIEHWNIPTETGKRVGSVLSAYLADAENFAELVATLFMPLPSFWSDQYDMKIQGFGMPGLADRYELVAGELSDELVMGYFRGEILIGVVGIGMTSEVMKYRKELVS